VGTGAWLTGCLVQNLVQLRAERAPKTPLGSSLLR